MFVQLASSLHLPLILLHRHNGAAKHKVCITYNNTARVCPECLDNICYVDNIQPPPPPPGLTFLLGKSQIRPGYWIVGYIYVCSPLTLYRLITADSWIQPQWNWDFPVVEWIKEMMTNYRPPEGVRDPTRSWCDVLTDCGSQIWKWNKPNCSLIGLGNSDLIEVVRCW